MKHASPAYDDEDATWKGRADAPGGGSPPRWLHDAGGRRHSPGPG